MSHIFLWGDSESNKKIHLLSWNTICQNKAGGGLGLRLLEKVNEAFSMKLVWGYLNHNNLWTRVLNAKYENSRRKAIFIISSGDSHFWKAICRTSPKFIAGSKVDIGDGRTTEFWNDAWLREDFRLADFVVWPVPERMLKEKVSEYVSTNGGWKWETFSRFLPVGVCMEIANFRLPSVLSRDRFTWVLTEDGEFTIKSAYNSLVKDHNKSRNEVASLWNAIWVIKASNRILHFIWIACHGRLMTNVRKRRLGLDSDF